MGATNLQCNVNTIKLAINQNYPVNIVIRKMNTGSYKYIVRALSIPGTPVYYEVYKYTCSGKYIGKVLVDVFHHDIKYNNIKFNIPDSVKKTILEFNQIIY